MKKLLTAAMLAVATLVPATGARAEAGACTRLLGYSTTAQVWNAFQHLVPDAEWESQAHSGQSLHTWKDGGHGWTEPVLSPCGSPTRVVLEVADHVETWTDKRLQQTMSAVLLGIAANIPTETSILLFPVIGGPNETVCPDDGFFSSSIHPRIRHLDAWAAATYSNVTAIAPTFQVADCSQYKDHTGHLTAEGITFAADELVGSVT